MASTFWEEDAEPQQRPDGSFWEDDAAPPQQAKESEDYEQPGLGRRLYEQNVVIPVRAARKFVPYADTIQHQVIDPAIGLFTGESSDERQQKREQYDDYLRRQYPLLLDAYEVGADLTSSLYKPPVVQATEPIVNQAATHPERLGFNLETGLNTLPVVAGAALSAPKRSAQAVGFIKTRKAERPSLKKYEENPYYYDEYEAATEGKPREALIEEMKGNLTDYSSKKDSALREAREEAQRLDDSVKAEQKKAIMDMEDQTKLGTLDGDRVVEAVKGLQGEYQKTAGIRNKILEDSGGEIDIRVLKPIYQRAYNSVYSNADRDAIMNAWNELAKTAKPGATTQYSVSARELDRLRQVYQGMVDYRYGAHNQPYQYRLNSIANDINDVLDVSIPMNHPLRKQIQQETIRFKKAMELFGGEYPLGKIQSSLKDPMKKRDMINLNVPAIDDIIKTLDYRDKFKRDLAMGIKPEAPSQAAYDQAQSTLETLKSQKMGMTPDSAQSTLRSSLVSSPGNPAVNQEDKLRWYAENAHPGGPEDFYRKYEQNKVLRDLGTMDAAQGSRMVNLGRGIGGALGTAGGYFAGDKSGVAAAVGGGIGGGIGAALDYNASNFYRAGIKAPLKAPGVGRSITAGLGVSAEALNSKRQEIPFDKLAGTPYEGMFIKAVQEGGNKAAMLHYILSKRDPEYQALTTDTEKKKTIPTPQYKGLGADLGSIIDNFTGSDQVGLDPQEKAPEGFEYGEVVPQPASIKPFSFKKLFPKFSGEGSQIKQLPKMDGHGFGIKGFTFKQYRDMNVGGDQRRFWGDELHPSEKIAGKKFDEAYTAKHPDRETYMHHSDGAVIPNSEGGIRFGMARGVDAVPHEHVHAQIENMNKIHPAAQRALDWHYMNKMRSYGIDPKVITDKMHGPREMMSITRDLLDSQKSRMSYDLNTSSAKALRSNPYQIEGNRDTMNRLKKFWNDAAYEAENMTQDDLMAIIEQYKKSLRN